MGTAEQIKALIDKMQDNYLASGDLASDEAMLGGLFDRGNVILDALVILAEAVDAITTTLDDISAHQK